MTQAESRFTDERLQRIAKVLADPQRFALLRRIAAQPEVPCKLLVAEFPIKQATISHHLKELAEAELIDLRREGQCAILSARRQVIGDYLDQLRRMMLGDAEGLPPSSLGD